jgi:hypothetical protein
MSCTQTRGQGSTSFRPTAREPNAVLSELRRVLIAAAADLNMRARTRNSCPGSGLLVTPAPPDKGSVPHWERSETRTQPNRLPAYETGEVTRPLTARMSPAGIEPTRLGLGGPFCFHLRGLSSSTRIRTWDLLLMRETRYQLRYGAESPPPRIRTAPISFGD